MYNRRIAGAATAATAAAAALGRLGIAHAQTGPQGQGQQAGAAAFGT